MSAPSSGVVLPDTQNQAWSSSAFFPPSSRSGVAGFSLCCTTKSYRVGALNSRLSATADKSAFGYKMLQKMGWADGKGLGKHEDGMATHVRVKRRADALGV